MCNDYTRQRFVRVLGSIEIPDTKRNFNLAALQKGTPPPNSIYL